MTTLCHFSAIMLIIKFTDHQFHPPINEITDKILTYHPVNKLKIELILEEILLNIFTYGYNTTHLSVFIRFFHIKNQTYIFIYDNNAYFNLENYSKKNNLPTKNIKDMDTRGNGIKIILSISKSFRYRRYKNHNINLIVI